MDEERKEQEVEALLDKFAGETPPSKNWSLQEINSLLEESDEPFEEAPEYEEFDTGAAAAEADPHQITLEEETTGRYENAEPEEPDEPEETVTQEASDEEPEAHTDSGDWAAIHSAFAAEAEKFAQEAETFAAKAADFAASPTLRRHYEEEARAEEDHIFETILPETEPEEPAGTEELPAEELYAESISEPDLGEEPAPEPEVPVSEEPESEVPENPEKTPEPVVEKTAVDGAGIAAAAAGIATAAASLAKGFRTAADIPVAGMPTVNLHTSVSRPASAPEPVKQKVEELAKTEEPSAAEPADDTAVNAGATFEIPFAAEEESRAEEPEPEPRPEKKVSFHDEKTRPLDPIEPDNPVIMDPNAAEKVAAASLTEPAPEEEPEEDTPPAVNPVLGEEPEESPEKTAEETEADESEEEDEEKTGGFRAKFQSFRNRIVRMLEGGEQEDEFAEADLVNDGETDTEESRGEEETPKKSRFARAAAVLAGEKGVEHVSGKETFTAPEDDGKTRVFLTEEEREENRQKGDRFKGMDENPQSPKMVMELAEEQPAKTEKDAIAQKTVGLPAMHNTDIPHQLITGGMAEIPDESATMVFDPVSPDEPESDTASIDDYLDDRTRSFDRVAEEIPTATYTSDAAVTEELVTNPGMPVKEPEPARETTAEEGELDGQIMFSGFSEQEEPAEQIYEDREEEELRKKRDKRVADFKLKEGFLHDGEETEESAASLKNFPRFQRGAYVKDYIEDEYHGREDAKRIAQKLESGTKSSLYALIAQGVLTLISLIISGIVAGAHGNLEAIGGSAVACVIINLVLLLASAGFGYQIMMKGFQGITSRKWNAASGVVAVFAASLIEDIVLLFAETSSEAISLYTAAACFAMALTCLSRYLSMRRVRDGFSLVNNGADLYSTKIVTSDADAREIGKGLLADEDPVIGFNALADDPTGYLEDSFADDPADRYSSRPILIILGVALLAGIIFGIVKGSTATGFGVFAALTALGIPAFTLLTYNFSLFFDNYQFRKKHTAIVGHRAVEKSAYVDTFAINSTDLFPKGACSIIGIKTFSDMRIDDAILNAASLVIGAGGPLADVFDKTILGKNDLLPECEDLTYEEKLGLSAWVGERKVLFGSRQFLINHNVETPDLEFERQYVHDGRQVMYLAISGKMAAMFVLRYRANKRMRRALQDFDRAGITVLVRNTDCNVTEEMICKKFKVPVSAVKVISPKSGDLLKTYQEGAEGTQSSRVGILHNGSAESSMRALYEARRLYDNVSINNILCIAYSAVSMLIGIILAITSSIGPGSISDGKVVLFQFLWTAVAVGIGWFRSRTSNQ